MAESKQALRSRIKSVNSTRKITKAMEMIANAKLFRLRNKMESNRIYAKKLEGTVIDIVQNTIELDNLKLVIATAYPETKSYFVTNIDYLKKYFDIYEVCL